MSGGPSVFTMVFIREIQETSDREKEIERCWGLSFLIFKSKAKELQRVSKVKTNLVSCLWNFSICKSLCGSGVVAFHRRDLCNMQTLEKDEVFHPAEAAWVFPPCQPGPGQPVDTEALRPEKEGTL